MKALSIREPWAWLIAVGWKDIENRDWYTNFRGRFLIHAAEAWDAEDHFNDPVFRRLLERNLTPEQLTRYMQAEMFMPRGAIVGEAEIYDCAREGDWIANGSKWFFGPYGFAIRNAKMWTPIPYRGSLGFFEVTGISIPVAR